MQKLILANQKGGSGKTTMTANLAGALVEAGQTVLAVDMDPQAQLAAALGAQDALSYADDGTLVSPTIADLLTPAAGRKVTVAETMVATPFPGLFLLPGSQSLEESRRAIESNPAAGLHALRRVLSPQSLASTGQDFDWVLVDTAPKLDVLLQNALVAADHVLAVLAPEMQQAEPLTRFLGVVETVRENLHPDLNLAGVLFNKANYNWNATTSIPALLTDMGLPVLQTVIPMYSRLANAYGSGPVVLTAPNSREAGVIRAAAQEVIDFVAAAAGERTTS